MVDASLRGDVMKSVQEVDEAAAALRLLLTLRGSQLVHEEQLRRLLDQLEAEKKGGKASGTRLVRLVARITKSVCEEWSKK